MKKDIGALWVKTSKNGKQFLTGTINGQKIVIFQNNYKKEQKQPDYKVYEAEQQQDPWPPDNVLKPVAPEQAVKNAQAIKHAITPLPVPQREMFLSEEDVPF